MRMEHNHFRIPPDSELARFLEEVGELPVILEKNGKRYRITAESAEIDESEYDPEAAREALQRAVLSWSDVDTEALIEHIYQARAAGSRPATQPE